MMHGMARAILAAAAVAGGAASAQEAAAPAAGGAPAAGDFLCSELATMDQETASAALYFIAGYGLGASGGGGGTAPVADGGEAGGGEATGEAAEVPQSPDAAASTEPSTDLTAAVQGDAIEVRMSGFYEIPVERVVGSCATSPDRRVTEVIEEERG